MAQAEASRSLQRLRKLWFVRQRTFQTTGLGRNLPVMCRPQADSIGVDGSPDRPLARLQYANVRREVFVDDVLGLNPLHLLDIDFVKAALLKVIDQRGVCLTFI